MELQVGQEGDLKWYVDSYKYASKMELIPYTVIASNPKMIESYKEPLFGVLVWILNRLFNGNVSLYKFSISIIEYSLMVASVIYFGRKSGFKTIVIMSGIVVMCFFPYIFTSKMNIIRQSLANSIFLFVMIRVFFYKKREWLGLVAIPLLHTSSVFFLPLLILSGFEKPFQKSWYLFVCFLIPVVLYYFFTHFMGGGDVGFLLGENSGEAAFNRIAQGAAGDYSLSITNAFICLIMLLYALFIYLRNSLVLIGGMRRFLSVFILLAVTVLINMNTQIGARFNHYALSFMPFLLMLFFHFKKVDDRILSFLSLGVITVFSIYLHFGFWTFDVTAGGWVTPVFGYLF